MNLEKNLPLVFLEIELKFEIANTTIDFMATKSKSLNPDEINIQPYDYVFHESAQMVTLNEENNLVDQLQNQTNGILVKDVYGDLFGMHFRKNEMISKADLLISFIYVVLR